MEHHCIPDMTQVVKKITLNSPPYHGGCWSCYVGYSTSCRSGEWWVLYWYSIIITIVHHSQGSLVPRLAPRNEACPWSLMYCTISEKGASMYIYDSMIGWLIFQYGRLPAEHFGHEVIPDHCIILQCWYLQQLVLKDLAYETALVTFQ